MLRLFQLFQPAPPLPLIEDKTKVTKEYNYWRWRIFYSMLFGYAFYYLTRKSFTFAMPALMTDLGFDKSQLGFLATVWALAYGLSKFANGVMADHSNARYFMATGLILTGICNICFGLSSSIVMFAIFWGLNGWCQGLGWPPCARLLTHWYSRSERGSWWSSFNVAHNLGGGTIPLLASLCVMYWGWRYALFVPGTIAILMGLLLIERLRDTPRSLGLPAIEDFRDDYSGVAARETEKELTAKQILWDYVLTNPVIWVLAVAYFFVYIIRTGFNDWTVLFLVETKGYSTLGASSLITVFEAGGFCGNLLAGWASDYIFQARRGPVNALFAVGIVLSVFALWNVPEGYVILDNVVMFFIGFFVFGPQVLIGLAAAEWSHKKAAATATGFCGWCAYVGSASAGYPLGKIAQDYGWEGFFWVMITCSLLSVLLLSTLWTADKKKVAVPVTT